MSIPMYKKIQQDLFHLIVSGQLREGDKVPSESELMAHYYVSAITAKNALNALADQGLITRVRGKGSFVNSSPYSVSRAESLTLPLSIGAIFPSLSSPIDQNYIMILNELCQKNNHHLYTCCSLENCRQEQELLEQFIKNGIQGTIVFPVVNERTNPLLSRLTSRANHGKPYPLVFIDRYLENIKCSHVVADNEQGARLAAEYLLNTVDGQAAILHFPLVNSAVNERYQSFRSAFLKAGSSFTVQNDCLINDLHLLNQTSENRIEYIMNTILTYLNRHSHLRGIFCTNAEIAQIAYYAVIETGRMPGVDFEIVSFDPPYLPGVHFIQQDSRAMVQNALNLLLAQIRGDFSVIHTRIPTSFIYMDIHPTQAHSLRYLIKGPNQPF
ncbi:MAG TPA: GntR family transcriptional regulator [Candidatus Eisenbergiella intestinipullorum]|nr:GntR family transcriptional regulator [Candidatus Eisenbergiella intestinipullorum]